MLCFHGRKGGRMRRHTKVWRGKSSIGLKLHTCVYLLSYLIRGVDRRGEGIAQNLKIDRWADPRPQKAIRATPRSLDFTQRRHCRKMKQGTLYINEDKLVAVCRSDFQAVRMKGVDYVRGCCTNPDKKGTLPYTSQSGLLVTSTNTALQGVSKPQDKHSLPSVGQQFQPKI